MSNYLAIATVTETLRQFVLESIQTVPMLSAAPIVRARRPENVGPQFVGANLYLYRVAPNPALSNRDLPTRGGNGVLLKRPQLALDLSYLLTFYGDENALEPQRMMGAAIAALHARPTLTPELIQGAMERTVPAGFLRTSDLPFQVERVRVTAATLTLEELSKIWTVFFQITHALTVAYDASVIFVDSDLTPSDALPVRQVRGQVVAEAPLEIRSITPDTVPFEPVASIDIEFAQVPPAAARILVEGQPVSVTRTNQHVGTVAIPEGTPPGAVLVSAPGGSSAGFVLQPAITGPIIASSLADRGGALVPVLVVPFAPDADPDQILELLLNPAHPTGEVTQSYCLGTLMRFSLDGVLAAELEGSGVTGRLVAGFAAQNIGLSPESTITAFERGSKWRIDDSVNELSYLIRENGKLLTLDCLTAGKWQNAVAFRAAAVLPGDYLVRLRVDRLVKAQSPLTYDAPGPEATFAGPLVSVP
jgi:hypothetical protein